MDYSQLFLSFNGRINRQPFWIGILILIGISIVLQIVIYTILGPEAGAIASGILGLLFIYPALAVYAKRCHDRDKSAWWLLLLLVPLVGAIWLIVDLGILEGTRGDNRFGPDPLAG